MAVTFYAVFVGGGWSQGLFLFCMTGHMDAGLRSCGSWAEFRFLLFTPY